MSQPSSLPVFSFSGTALLSCRIPLVTLRTPPSPPGLVCDIPGTRELSGQPQLRLGPCSPTSWRWVHTSSLPSQPDTTPQMPPARKQEAFPPSFPPQASGLFQIPDSMLSVAQAGHQGSRPRPAVGIYLLLLFPGGGARRGFLLDQTSRAP